MASSIIRFEVDREGKCFSKSFRGKMDYENSSFLRCQMPIVSKANGLFAEFAVFSAESDSQANTAMDSNRPFSPIFGEMLDLADNEYQKTLHELVFTT